KTINEEIRSKKERKENPEMMEEKPSQAAFDYTNVIIEAILTAALAYGIFCTSIVDSTLGPYIPQYYTISSSQQPPVIQKEEEFLERVQNPVTRIPGNRAIMTKVIIFVLIIVAVKYYKSSL